MSRGAGNSGCGPEYQMSVSAARTGEENSLRARTMTMTTVEQMNNQGETIQDMTDIPK